MGGEECHLVNTLSCFFFRHDGAEGKGVMASPIYKHSTV